MFGIFLALSSLIALSMAQCGTVVRVNFTSGENQFIQGQLQSGACMYIMVVAGLPSGFTFRIANNYVQGCPLCAGFNINAGSSTFYCETGTRFQVTCDVFSYIVECANQWSSCDYRFQMNVISNQKSNAHKRASCVTYGCSDVSRSPVHPIQPGQGQIQIH